MGNPASKVEGEVPEEQHCSEGSVPSTPILTPKVVNKDKELDPRSPSANVIRTPLEFLSFSDTPQGKPIEGEEGAAETAVTAENYTVLKEDPRSPTAEFERTPIVVVSAAETEPVMKPRNKRLENVRNQDAIVRTPAAKLLESSPVSGGKPKPIRQRKSLLGLLETNLDYTETDLDVAAREKALYGVVAEAEQDAAASQVVDEAPEKSDAEVQTDGADIIILPADLRPSGDENALKSSAESVKDFDRKLSNLIYEDDDSEPVVKSVAAASKDGARTPLGERNSNRPAAKNQLRVSDKPRKSANMSRIPVFSKNVRQQQQQCENTPPPRGVLAANRGNDQIRQPQWDHDATLII